MKLVSLLISAVAVSDLCVVVSLMQFAGWENLAQAFGASLGVWINLFVAVVTATLSVALLRCARAATES